MTLGEGLPRRRGASFPKWLITSFFYTLHCWEAAKVRRCCLPLIVMYFTVSPPSFSRNIDKSDAKLVRTGQTTGASHASHLGDCCPSAYSSGVSYVKKRQVWKSRSETDWPHLEIMPDFSTEKNRGTLILTSTCWQEISLPNTVELTTVIPRKQKICRFKCRFFPVFENSRGSIVCLRAANPVTRHDWAVLFLRTCLFQFDSQQTALFPGGANQFLIGTFTPASSLRMILHYYRPMDSNRPSD